MNSRILAIALAVLPAPALAQAAKAPNSVYSAGGQSSEIPKEKRDKVRAALMDLTIERLPKADFPVELGAKLPETVKHYQLPVTVLDLAPELRGYDYVMIGDEVVLLNPGTREIVAILTG